MIEVRIDREHFQKINDQILAWLSDNVGQGSVRYKKNTWMGTNDWYCYDDAPEEDEFENPEEYDSSEMVFVFRREEDAVMFKLKWS